MKTHILRALILLFFVKNLICQTISQENLKDNLKFIGSIELKGRLPGTESYDLASDFCIQKFKEYGVKNFSGINNYKQFFKLENNRIIGPCEFNIIHAERGFLKLKHGTAYTLRGFTGSATGTFDIVFCGYGISTDNYDDYKNVNVKNKAVIIYKANPKFENVNVEPFSIRNRIKTAAEKGAAAVIFVNTPDAKNTHPIGSVMDGKGEHFHNIPAIEIDHKTAELFFDGSGFSFADTYNTILEKKAPNSIELKSKAMIDIKAIYNPAVDVYNIIGYIEGKNVSKKDEYILLTAHLDHVGSQCEVVFPGANDNASGSAAILELARYFSEYKPEHSIIFALLTAEESGLQGAEFLAANLPISSNKIIAALNFDCIASGDSIQLGNGLTNPELFKLAKSLDNNNLIIKDTWSNGGADLTPFVKAGIPGLYFVTKYSYTHLHLQTDTFENCNLDLFEKVVILATELIKNIDKGKYKRENIIKTESE